MIHEADRFDAEEIATVDYQITVTSIIGAGSSIKATSCMRCRGIAAKGRSGTDSEGAGRCVRRNDRPEWGGDFQSAARIGP